MFACIRTKLMHMIWTKRSKDCPCLGVIEADTANSLKYKLCLGKFISSFC